MTDDEIQKEFLQGDALAILMCPPFIKYPIPPPEQANCVFTHCDDCKRVIWISEKKRAIRDARPKEMSYVVCYDCLKHKAETDRKFFDDHIRVNL